MKTVLFLRHTLKPRRCPIYSQDVCFLSSFKHADIVIEPAKIRKKIPAHDVQLGFGKYFTDHMLSIKWTGKYGWDVPRIHEFRDISLHPAAKTLHYATGAFEGIKAFRGVDNVIRIFRMNLNMSRMQKSVNRSSLPGFDADEFQKCITSLVKLDHDWVPSGMNKALYIRPTAIGTDPTLGVDKSAETLMFVILSPVGSYYSTGENSVSLYADPSRVRAWPGGFGDCKLNSNYSPTIYVQQQAIKAGCQQVLWLFGPDQLLTEAGTMNLFVFWTNEKGELEVCTPPLDGLILPGVVRTSLLEMLPTWNKYPVRERYISMTQVVQAVKENRMHGMFGTGTACVLVPIKEIVFKNEKLKIPIDGEGVELTKMCIQGLKDIQYGVIKSHPWAVPVDTE